MPVKRRSIDTTTPNHTTRSAMDSLLRVNSILPENKPTNTITNSWLINTEKGKINPQTPHVKSSDFINK